MIVLFSIGLLAVILAYLGSRKYLKYGLGLSFFVLWCVYAIRYNYGNDFWNYSYHFDEISKYKSIVQCFNDYEPTWSVLMWLFKFLGFSEFCAFIGFLYNIIIYRFVKYNVPVKWWPFAVFIYVFNPNLYALSFSMMRQFLAMSIILYSWDYLKNGKTLVPFILCILAATIHNSSFVFIPFIFLSYFTNTNDRVWFWVLIGVFLLLGFSQAFYADALTIMSDQNYLAHYVNEHSMREGTLSFGLGFLILSIPTFITLYYLYTNNYSRLKIVEWRYISILGIFTTFFSLLGQLNMLIIRVSYYFLIFTIGSAPVVLYIMKNRTAKISLMMLFCIGELYSYLLFFSSEVYSPMFSEFHTIFEK